MKSSKLFGYGHIIEQVEEERHIRINRRFAMVLLLLVLGAAAVAFILRMRDSGFRWDLFAETLSGANPALIALACLAILLTYPGRVLRWRVMMRPVKPHSSFRQILNATMVGFTAVVFFGRPGELVRPWLIARSENVPMSSQVAAWFLERILDLLMVLLLFGYALTHVDDTAAVGEGMRLVLKSGGVVALALGAACVAVILFSAFLGDQSQRWFDWAVRVLPATIATRLRGLFSSFLDGMRSTGSASSLGELFFYTAVEWVVIVSGMYFALIAYPPTAGFSVTSTLVFAGFVAFGSAVQLPGVGGGFQVAAILVLTELFGLKLEAATGATLLIWAVSWLTVIPFGMAIAFSQGLKWGSLRHVEAPAGEVL